MRRLHGGNKAVKAALADWQSFCKLADTKAPAGKHSHKKELWELIERSAPFPFTTSEGPVWLVVRVLFKKTDKKYYLDFRALERKAYTDEEGKVKYYFAKTDIGLNLPLAKWIQGRDIIDKYLEKYRKNI